MTPKLLKPCFLPGLSGVLLALSFPKADQGYLAWIALVPLLVFARLSKSVNKAFLGGFAAGAIEFFILLIWMPTVLMRYGGVPVPLAWALHGLAVVVLGFYPGLTCALTAYCIRRRGWLALFIFPFCWIVFEYIRGHFVVGGFPWLLMGYSQTDYLSLIQVADITGVYGLSFLIVWTNCALAWLLLRHHHKSACLWPLAASVVMIFCCLIYGHYASVRWNGITPVFRAALLQGNLSFDEPERVLAGKFMDGYVQMADQIKPLNVDLLVLPESPAPLSYQYDSNYREALSALAGRYSLGIVLNNIAYRESVGDIRYYNSAYFLAPDGKELGRYDKIHLVPFGEYMPWQNLLPFAETISKDVGGFSPGEKYSVIRMGNHEANAVICFEAVFPELVRRFVQNGSGLIINLTNDQWYGNSAAPYQHFEMARWRAIENRRYLLRAANSGVSAIIDPGGRVQAATGLLQQATCVGKFTFLSETTVYTRYGDFFVILCAIIMSAVLIATQIAPAKGKQQS